MEEYKLVLLGGEYYLLDHKMAKNVGEFFMERLTTGFWDLFHVDSVHDIVHNGFKILASTRELKGILRIDRISVNVDPRNSFTPEDMRGAMLWMAEVTSFREKGLLEESPLVLIDNYLETVKNEWRCEILVDLLPGPISGGLIPSGVIGGKGLQVHHTKAPKNVDGYIKIVSIK